MLLCVQIPFRVLPPGVKKYVSIERCNQMLSHPLSSLPPVDRYVLARIVGVGCSRDSPQHHSYTWVRSSDCDVNAYDAYKEEECDSIHDGIDPFSDPGRSCFSQGNEELAL